PVCAGTSVTFTATPTNGGTTPAYQWKVNGLVAGTNNATYSYTPANTDEVTCVLTSNATCATGNPATSSSVTMIVNPNLPVSVSIGASANPVCAGTSVTFTATPTNGGTTPAYQWKVNGLVAGTNNATYSYIPTNGDLILVEMTSNATACLAGSLATSNTVTATVIPQGTTELSYRFANPRITRVSGFDNFEFDIQVKANEAGTFFWKGQFSLNFDNTTLSTDAANWDAIPTSPFSANNSLGHAKYSVALTITGSTLNIEYKGDVNATEKAATSDDFVEITSTYQTMASVRGRILSNTGIAGIDFNESNMNGQQFYKLSASPWYAAYKNPNLYDPADFTDTYVGRVFGASYFWTQVGGPVDWDDAVNTSVWDGSAAIPGGSLANASNLRIHNPATLTLPIDGKMTVAENTEIKTANGLILESNDSGTGSLITESSSGVGSASAKRYMTTDAWHLVSSPLSGQSIQDFLSTNANVATDFYNSSIRGMMDYNSELNEWNNYFLNNTAGNLAAGKGFCIRTDASSAVTFNGSLQAGSVPVSAIANYWNCIGNPYTSAIRINNDVYGNANFLSENETNLDLSFGAIYVWENPDANNGGDFYSVYSNALPAYNFQQGQAFFVKMKDHESLNFNSGMQIHEPALALKSTKDVWPTIKLGASVNSQKSSTIIAFNSGMTKGLDPTYDAGLLKGGSDLLVYSRLAEDNGIDFAIQALPENDFSSTVIPVGLDYKTGGDVVFSAELINLPADCQVILEDKWSKTFTDLSKNVYRTTIAANSIITDRFQLHTSYLTTGLDMDFFKGKLSAYAIRNVEIRVKGHVSKQAIATLYDIQGRIVLVKNLEEGTLNVIRTPNIKTAIYMLFVNDNGKSQGFKISVRE
ncbi:MAG: hypothetical protein Q8N05_20005, partial [Bacteroidota bacterium]|nr:hypothetical protein [Bacteroidota bacterium]